MSQLLSADADSKLDSELGDTVASRDSIRASSLESLQCTHSLTARRIRRRAKRKTDNIAQLASPASPARLVRLFDLLESVHLSRTSSRNAAQLTTGANEIKYLLKVIILFCFCRFLLYSIFFSNKGN